MSEQRELHASEIAKFEAEAQEKLALARKATAEAITAECTASVALIQKAQMDELRQKELASDSRHHLYRFSGAVSESSVKSCMTKLSEWARQDPKPQSVEIVFSSPGGSIIEGLVLFDFIQQVRREGIHVTTSTLGYAASMAGILLQAGDHRVMARESWLLIHEASFGTGGSFGQVEDTVDWVKKMQVRIVDIFVERSKVSRTFFKKNWSRRDWWISAPDALSLGFIDEVN